MSLELGQILEGKYRIKRVIGEGGMGAVYEGENLRIQRRVAIKVVHAAFSGNREIVARFEREAQSAGRIGNDHILEVLDLGSLSDGSHFMVLEFLDGETLSSRIERLERLAPRDATALARQILKGLAAAHSAGIVHRDLKPDNIFILREKAGTPDFVKIIDFGISKFQPLAGEAMHMTSTGAVMGTPYYMSPEQARGAREADARSDIYAVGVILHECVTGRVPFNGENFNELLFKIVLSEAPDPRELVPDLDPAFVGIIQKAMARDVTARFQTAKELSDALAAWAAGGARTVLHDAAVDAAPRVTAGSWATSHRPSAVLPRSRLLLAIGGGAAIAVFIVTGLLVGRGGTRTVESPVPTAVEVVPPPETVTPPSHEPAAAGPSVESGSGGAPPRVVGKPPAPKARKHEAPTLIAGKRPDFGY